MHPCRLCLPLLALLLCARHACSRQLRADSGSLVAEPVVLELNPVIPGSALRPVGSGEVVFLKDALIQAASLSSSFTSNNFTLLKIMQDFDVQPGGQLFVNNNTLEVTAESCSVIQQFISGAATKAMASQISTFRDIGRIHFHSWEEPGLTATNLIWQCSQSICDASGNKASPATHKLIVNDNADLLAGSAAVSYASWNTACQSEFVLDISTTITVDEEWPAAGFYINRNTTWKGQGRRQTVLDLQLKSGLWILGPDAFITISNLQLVNNPSYSPPVTSSVQLWSWSFIRRIGIHRVNLSETTIVVAPDEFSYWSYWTQVFQSFDPKMASIATWMTQAGVDFIKIIKGDANEILYETYRSRSFLGNQVLLSRLSPLRPLMPGASGIGKVVEANTDILPFVMLIRNNAELLQALQMLNTPALEQQYAQYGFSPQATTVLMLDANITIDRQLWPIEGVSIANKQFVIMGNPYSGKTIYLDWGNSVNLIVLGPGAKLIFKDLTMINMGHYYEFNIAAGQTEAWMAMDVLVWACKLNRDAYNLQVQLRRVVTLVSSEEYGLLTTCTSLRALGILNVSPRTNGVPENTVKSFGSLLALDPATQLDLLRRATLARGNSWWEVACATFVNIGVGGSELVLSKMNMTSASISYCRVLSVEAYDVVIAASSLVAPRPDLLPADSSQQPTTPAALPPSAGSASNTSTYPAGAPSTATSSSRSAETDSSPSGKTVNPVLIPLVATFGSMALLAVGAFFVMKAHQRKAKAAVLGLTDQDGKLHEDKAAAAGGGGGGGGEPDGNGHHRDAGSTGSSKSLDQTHSPAAALVVQGNGQSDKADDEVDVEAFAAATAARQARSTQDGHELVAAHDRAGEHHSAPLPVFTQLRVWWKRRRSRAGSMASSKQDVEATEGGGFSGRPSHATETGQAPDLHLGQAQAGMGAGRGRESAKGPFKQLSVMGGGATVVAGNGPHTDTTGSAPSLPAAAEITPLLAGLLAARNANAVHVLAGDALPGQPAPRRRTPDAPRDETLLQELHGLSAKLAAGVKDDALLIGDVLGSGAFSTVYHGVWQGLPVAVKSLVFSTQRRQMALKEAALSKSICHPNIVATYSYDLQPLTFTGLTDGNDAATTQLQVSQKGKDPQEWRLYIIQEYCDGGSLRKALDDGVLLVGDVPNRRTSIHSVDSSASREHPLHAKPTVSPSTGKGASKVTMKYAISLALDIAQAMHHLHSKNIIHGDLKPENVLLSSRQFNTTIGSKESGRTSSEAGPSPDTPTCCNHAYMYRAKVADFGLSIIMDDQQSHVSNMKVGTPFYLAPEVQHAGRVTTSADVFSFGVILWELASGNPVWVRQKQQDGPGYTLKYHPTFPSLPPGTHPDFVKLVKSCLSSSLVRRPRFEVVCTVLTNLLTQSPTIHMTATDGGSAASSGKLSLMPGIVSVQDASNGTPDQHGVQGSDKLSKVERRAETQSGQPLEKRPSRLSSCSHASTRQMSRRARRARHRGLPSTSTRSQRAVSHSSEHVTSCSSDSTLGYKSFGQSTAFRVSGSSSTSSFTASPEKSVQASKDSMSPFASYTSSQQAILGSPKPSFQSSLSYQPSKGPPSATVASTPSVRTASTGQSGKHNLQHMPLLPDTVSSAAATGSSATTTTTTTTSVSRTAPPLDTHETRGSASAQHVTGTAGSAVELNSTVTSNGAAQAQASGDCMLQTNSTCTKAEPVEEVAEQVAVDDGSASSDSNVSLNIPVVPWFALIPPAFNGSQGLSASSPSSFGTHAPRTAGQLASNDQNQHDLNAQDAQGADCGMNQGGLDKVQGVGVFASLSNPGIASPTTSNSPGPVRSKPTSPPVSGGVIKPVLSSVVSAAASRRLAMHRLAQAAQFIGTGRGTVSSMHKHRLSSMPRSLEPVREVDHPDDPMCPCSAMEDTKHRIGNNEQLLMPRSAAACLSGQGCNQHQDFRGFSPSRHSMGRALEGPGLLGSMWDARQTGEGRGSGADMAQGSVGGDCDCGQDALGCPSPWSTSLATLDALSLSSPVPVRYGAVSGKPMPRNSILASAHRYAVTGLVAPKMFFQQTNSDDSIHASPSRQLSSEQPSSHTPPLQAAGKGTADSTIQGVPPLLLHPAESAPLMGTGASGHADRTARTARVSAGDGQGEAHEEVVRSNSWPDEQGDVSVVLLGAAHGAGYSSAPTSRCDVAVALNPSVDGKRSDSGGRQLTQQLLDDELLSGLADFLRAAPKKVPAAAAAANINISLLRQASSSHHASGSVPLPEAVQVKRSASCRLPQSSHPRELTAQGSRSAGRMSVGQDLDSPGHESSLVMAAVAPALPPLWGAVAVAMLPGGVSPATPTAAVCPPSWSFRSRQNWSDPGSSRRGGGVNISQARASDRPTHEHEAASIKGSISTSSSDYSLGSDRMSSSCQAVQDSSEVGSGLLSLLGLCDEDMPAFRQSWDGEPEPSGTLE